MKINKLTLLSALLFVTLGLFAQDQKYAFKVLANKGGSEVKTGDAWQPIKTGTTINKNDELKVSENSYVGLVHVTGKPIELKQAGSYTVSDLEKKIGTGSSVINKYTDFILSSNSAEAKKNRLSATGAIHRGTDGTGAAPAIQIMLPENQHSGIYNSAAIISWEGSVVPGPYVVVLNNMFGEELARVETPESVLRLDLTDPKFVKENAVLVQVSSKADPSKKSAEKLIKKLSPADQDKIKVSLGEIMGEVAEQTALNKFILAGFYETNFLFIDAVAAYEEAIRLAPEVQEYKEAYDDFLIRHGMKR
ncbi:hypothetical protein [Pseudochryseolinea flava]|uniref:Tetratricopeptide repeat protein n=1 Tax=Pseudochryseolinea flava TaxID=2059302 RepID=A0A364Y122_9BACT|nr:hypothetical protein [Pseudochryseolinea flava]RAV99796.1 hypothetical protein DQQ10_17280 [Pseudochryseolinea flava]